MAPTFNRDPKDIVFRQDWLEPADRAMQAVADATVNFPGAAGRRWRNFLHGIWLGHPLHPVIVTVPIGALSAVALLDALEAVTPGGRKKYAAGTDAALNLGLVTSVAAAVTGINDWQHTKHRVRRVGVAHGVTNSLALVLYLVSWFLRARDSRPAGRAFGWIGYLVLALGAYFGGSLVSEESLGANHAPKRPSLPEEFVPVLPDADLADGQMREAQAAGIPVLLARRQGELFAIANTCAHLGGPLCQGKMEGDSVVCPWHGSRFSLRDGRVLEGPSAFAQPLFETRVRNGQIEVRLAR